MGSPDVAALPTSTCAGPGLHRRSDTHRNGGCRSPGSAPISPVGGTRSGSKTFGRARGMLTARWQLFGLMMAGLLLHSMTASHTQPWMSAAPGSLSGGVAIRGMSAASGQGSGAGGESSSRARALVEEHVEDSRSGRLSTLAAAAAGFVSPQSKPSPPPSPIPQAWLEGGTLGQWPKPYRNKTRQVVPNSISEWRCTADAANFSLAAATHNPLLQSTQWRQRYGDNVSMFKWCREGLPEEVPQLQQVLKLESAKARPERGLTVVTQLSLERFQMLGNQCSTWPLQISAVLYIPLLKGRIFSAEEPSWNKKSLDVGLAETLSFFAEMEASNSSCILDLEVVVEERCDRYSAMLYPANAARNRAVVNAHTEAMLLVDVDFAVSRSLADLVKGEATYARLMSMLHNRNAVVLPAFETQDDGEAGRQVALEAVRRGKPYVVNKFEWNIVFGFHVPQYPQGHQATDYWRWVKSHSAYPVQYQIGYEPYIMMHRDHIPFYDERFRGYYWNKVQHLMHISLQNGFNFLVHPTAFVVHVPHKKPSTKWLTRKMGQKEKNHMLFDNALFHMRQMDFVPVTSWSELCTPDAAPLLPGEGEIRQVAAMKAAAERAAAEQAELLMQQHAGLQEAAAAAAAKRATEVAEAEAWMANNAEAASAATKQRQEASVGADAAFLASHQAHQQLVAATAAAAAGGQQAAAQAAEQAAIAQQVAETSGTVAAEQVAEQGAQVTVEQAAGAQQAEATVAEVAGQAAEQAVAGTDEQAATAVANPVPVEQAVASTAEQGATAATTAAAGEQPAAVAAADQAAVQQLVAAADQQVATEQQDPLATAQQAQQAQQAVSAEEQQAQQAVSAEEQQAQQAVSAEGQQAQQAVSAEGQQAMPGNVQTQPQANQQQPGAVDANPAVEAGAGAAVTAAEEHPAAGSDPGVQQQAAAVAQAVVEQSATTEQAVQAQEQHAQHPVDGVQQADVQQAEAAAAGMADGKQAAAAATEGVVAAAQDVVSQTDSSEGGALVQVSSNSGSGQGGETAAEQRRL